MCVRDREIPEQLSGTKPYTQVGDVVVDGFEEADEVDLLPPLHFLGAGVEG